MKNPSIYLYKFLISALLCTISILAAAQENYKPMLVEGKSWLMMDEMFGPDNKFQKYTYTVCGDSIERGIKCKKVRIEYINPSDPSYNTIHLPFFEKDGCLYSFIDGISKLLDFNLDVGDEAAEAGRVIKKDTIFIKGKNYKRLTFEKCFGENNLPVIWVEGIGYNIDRYMTYVQRPINYPINTYILACYENGECIFEWDDFFAESISTGISNTEADSKQPQQKMYDLTGKTLKTPRKGEVYIKDGKKYVGR